MNCPRIGGLTVERLKSRLPTALVMFRSPCESTTTTTNMAHRQLIHLVHEIFMTFLLDGRYYEYMVETFDLDPDKW